MVLMLLSSVGYGADWKQFSTATDDGTSWFYDTQTIFRGQNIIKVWIKKVLSDKSKEKYIKNFYDMNGIKDISCTIEGGEIDCSKNRHRCILFFWYDAKGNVICKAKDSNSPFHPIHSNSPMAKLVEIVCKEGGGGK